MDDDRTLIGNNVKATLRLPRRASAEVLFSPRKDKIFIISIKSRYTQRQAPCANRHAPNTTHTVNFTQPFPSYPNINCLGLMISARISIESTIRGPGRLKYWLPSAI